MTENRKIFAAAIASLLMSGCPLKDDYYVSADTVSVGGATGGARSSDAGVGGNENGGSNIGGVAGGGGSSPNLIANSGFENGTTGWDIFGATLGTKLTTSQQFAHSGTFSLFVSGRTQAYQGPRYLLTGLLTTGKSYRAEVWLRLPTGVVDTTGFNITARLGCGSGAFEYLFWVYGATVNSLGWTLLTGTNTLSGCTSGTIATVDLYVEGPTSVSAFYIDDVVFELI